MTRMRPANTDGEEGFLARWSRRKRDARDGQTETVDTPGVPEPAPDAKPVSQQEPAPDKTDEDMPPLETIDETTNMGDFFSPQVSEELRRVALRKLFHLPKFNIVDDLDDYNESFRDFAPLGEMITADMRYHMERAEEEARANLDPSTGDEPGADPAQERDDVTDHEEEDNTPSEALDVAADEPDESDAESVVESGDRA